MMFEQAGDAALKLTDSMLEEKTSIPYGLAAWLPDNPIEFGINRTKPEGIMSGSALRMYDNFISGWTGKHPAEILKKLYSDDLIYKEYPVLKMEPARCNHAWKTYQGFSDQFDYCEKCDVKR